MSAVEDPWPALEAAIMPWGISDRRIKNHDLLRPLWRRDGRPLGEVLTRLRRRGLVELENIELLPHVLATARQAHVGLGVPTVLPYMGGGSVSKEAGPSYSSRSWSDHLAKLSKRHGDRLDLSGLNLRWIPAYEAGERISVHIDGRELVGTVGCTSSAHPTFVLNTSLPLK